MKETSLKYKIREKICEYASRYKKCSLIIILSLLLTGIITYIQPQLIQQIIDSGFLKQNMNFVYFFTVLLFLFEGLKQLLDMMKVKFLVKIQNDIFKSLNEKVISKLTKLPLSYFERKNSTEIISAVSADVNTSISLVYIIIISWISPFLQIVGGIIGIFFVYKILLLPIAVFMCTKIFVVKRLFRERSQLFEENINKHVQYNAWLGDKINGIKEVKLWDFFQFRRKDIIKFSNDIVSNYKNTEMCTQKSLCIENLMNMLLNCLIYIICGLVMIENTMTVGRIMAIMSYCTLIIAPISIIIETLYSYADMKPSLERLFVFFHEVEEEVGNFDLLEEGKKSEFIVEMNNVSFSYEKSRKILNGINFKVRRGEKVAIIGENGSGKSTIFDLLCGFYPIEGGEILFHGINLNRWRLKELRKRISLVEQNPYIFCESIRNNLDIENKYQEKELDLFCKKMDLENFLKVCECGYNTSIEGNAVTISGGEKKKIAFIRELLKEGELLLLDETLNDCDERARVCFQSLLQNELRNKTVVLITHHEEELEYFEKVYCLEEGKLQLVSAK